MTIISLLCAIILYGVVLGTVHVTCKISIYTFLEENNVNQLHYLILIFFSLVVGMYTSVPILCNVINFMAYLIEESL